MKTFLLILTITINSAWAHECHNPISEHLNEAIAHNIKVAKMYSQISDGKSERISYTLINLEKLSKLFIRSLDNLAAPYQKQGIPLFCEEIPSMEGLPEFQERLPETLRPKEFFQYDRSTFSSSLKKLMKANRLDEAYELTSNNILLLEAAPNQQCLTRHFLESIAITLKLADSRRTQAENAGLPDPLNLIKKYIELQRQALILTSYLDKQAFPLQKDGLMILCQDVPAINWK